MTFETLFSPLKIGNFILKNRITLAPMFLCGYQVDITGEIKKEVRIPVFANGRINTPDLAEEIITKNKADAVALARPLFADPEFVQKIIENRADRIVKCMNDMVCGKQTMQDMDAVCSQWKKGDE